MPEARMFPGSRFESGLAMGLLVSFAAERCPIQLDRGRSSGVPDRRVGVCSRSPCSRPGYPRAVPRAWTPRSHCAVSQRPGPVWRQRQKCRNDSSKAAGVETLISRCPELAIFPAAVSQRPAPRQRTCQRML